jgi:hypothetical protein
MHVKDCEKKSVAIAFCFVFAFYFNSMTRGVENHSPTHKMRSGIQDGRVVREVRSHPEDHKFESQRWQ